MEKEKKEEKTDPCKNKPLDHDIMLFTLQWRLYALD